MMEAITYPFKTTPSGDLALSNEVSDIAITRGLLLVDIRSGERQFYSNYGSDLYPFSPNVIFSTLEAEVLQNSLNFWCVPVEDIYNYEVIDESIDTLNLRINIIFPEN